MKHKRMLSLLMAAVTGISAAAVPAIMQASPCLTAFAAEGDLGPTADGFYYTVDAENQAVTITGYSGSSTAVVIPSAIDGYPVKVIGKEAFMNKPITAVTISDTVEIIDESAFEASSLESVIIPPNVKELVKFAFVRCRQLTAAEIQGKTKIGPSTFNGCTAMTEAKMLDDIPYVSAWAFNGCTSLTTLEFHGAAVLGHYCIYGCTSLEDIMLNDNVRSEHNGMLPIHDCPIQKINGEPVLQHAADSNGISYPVINPAAETAIRNLFCRSLNIGFVETYCSELCTYIVQTETDDWMTPALKARRLHDWIIRHCEYEDNENGEWLGDYENHVASSVFLSYALNERGEGIGESVCEGYSKAYTMLLAEAGIESYMLYTNDHEWNLVNIDGEYYQVDVTWDDPVILTWSAENPVLHPIEDNTYGNIYSTNYKYFLKCDEDMKALHGEGYDGRAFDRYSTDEHELLRRYTDYSADKLTSCVQSFLDENHDGILDYDFDLDGKFFNHDFADDLNAYQGFLQFAYGVGKTTVEINDRMDEVLYNLHALHMGYWDYLNTMAPQSVTAANGETAEFKITMFGDNLTYQWYMYNQSAGRWEIMECADSIEPTLHISANAYTNGNQYMCYVWNQDGYYIYSNPVTLTVV